MKDSPVLPTWAPRVRPYLIRQLYENDALGMADEALLDEVGWGLHARCKSFIQAMEATHGKARCPVCDTIVCHTMGSKEVLRCGKCDWECPWRLYGGTIKNQQLNGGPEVVEMFQAFVEAYPKAHESKKKMLLIDGLIHGFHHYLRSGRTRRPVGVNLIRGDLSFVIDFLDKLAYGPGSTPGTAENKQQWREHINRRR